MTTKDATARTIQTIMEGIYGNKESLTVFIDLKKAFDTVSHNNLLKRLEEYGIEGVCLKSLQSYLFKREQKVRITGKEGDSLVIGYGVLQTRF